MRIDCETISDPHPPLETSETAVIASQGTQACGDELVVTGTLEETPEDTQDTQAGCHEMVVTGVKRKAVELNLLHLLVYHSWEEQKASKKQVLKEL